MPPTTAPDRPTDDHLDTTAAEHSGAGHDPPKEVADSRVSFALFASFFAVLLSLAALVGVAFKSDQSGSAGSTAATPPDASTSAPSQTTSEAAAGGALTLNMADYSFSPQNATAAAGKVKVTAINNGEVPHEMVLARTNADPSQLPTAPDGTVDEEQLNSPGEIPDVPPGATKKGTIDLKPGSYVMFCNLPGHYAAGMYGSVTVK